MALENDEGIREVLDGDLEAALDEVERHYGRVCDAARQHAAEAAQREVLRDPSPYITMRCYEQDHLMRLPITDCMTDKVHVWDIPISQILRAEPANANTILRRQ